MRVGTLCYATTQGLGYLARDFHAHGVVTDVLIQQHPGKATHADWYPAGTPIIPAKARVTGRPEVEDFLSRVDAMLFFETPFDWILPVRCRELSIRTALLTMYEWSLKAPPCEFDLYLCPSALDYDYFKETSKAVFLPVPTEAPWTERTKALKWLHNAGHIGSRNHKGTEELLRAIPLLRSEVEVTVRSQNLPGLMMLAHRTGAHRCDRLKIEGEHPYDSLWDGYDVLIQPEKYNGLSLPLQEAFARGMMVMTSDRYPHNTWLPRHPLVRVDHYTRAQVGKSYLEFDEAVVKPEVIAAMIDNWHGRDITEFSRAGKAWAEANSWEKLKPQYLAALAGTPPAALVGGG